MWPKLIVKFRRKEQPRKLAFVESSLDAYDFFLTLFHQKGIDSPVGGVGKNIPITLLNFDAAVLEHRMGQIAYDGVEVVEHLRIGVPQRDRGVSSE